MDENNKSTLTVPMAIVVAGLFIAGAIVVSQQTSGSPQADEGSQLIPKIEKEITLRSVVDGDHIRGDLSAPIKIVEYADTECPFCKTFHNTLLKVMAKYEKSGNVAWVYRHFPIDSLHSRATKEAEATECAYEQGGNNAFWKYLDRIMEVTPSNNRLDPATLGEIALFVKLDAEKLQSCLDSGKYSKKVEADVDDATDAGARGTPYSVIIDSSGRKIPLDGALPIEEIEKIISSL
ncbi:MAG: DsbA family protein [Candidatus Vogelbacteria bacterium]|nr:DsbA family protein [Candidatus Vogelbacteria bacterium]